MIAPLQQTIADKLADKAGIEAALRGAMREAVLMHARAGYPVAVWRDNRVVWLQPSDVFAMVAELDQQTNGPAPHAQ
jgi:hypothetical protein